MFVERGYTRVSQIMQQLSKHAQLNCQQCTRLKTSNKLKQWQIGTYRSKTSPKAEGLHKVVLGGIKSYNF